MFYLTIIFFQLYNFPNPTLKKLYPPPLISTHFSKEILTEIIKKIYCKKLPPPETISPLTHFSKKILTEIIKEIYCKKLPSQKQYTLDSFSKEILTEITRVSSWKKKFQFCCSVNVRHWEWEKTTQWWNFFCYCSQIKVLIKLKSDTNGYL